MQFKAVAMAALVAVVSAQLPTPTDPAQASALIALATALPSDVLASAASNPEGFASEVASSIAAGNTPEWYQALPTDVQSALASIYPVNVPASSTPSETASPTSAEVTEVTETSTETSTEVITSVPESIAPSGTGASSIGSNSTDVTSVVTPTLGPSGTDGGVSPTGGPEFPGAGSIPSAAVGAGIAGVFGFLVMLVL